MTTDAPADGEDIGAYSILMDIQGTEDHYGDMDFKVAGTAEGITAIQVSNLFRTFAASVCVFSRLWSLVCFPYSTWFRLCAAAPRKTPRFFFVVGTVDILSVARL